MKKLYSVLFGATLLAMVAFTSYTPKTVAQAQRRPSAAVLFHVTILWPSGQEYPSNIVIAVASSSPNAPVIKTLTPAADAIEMLLTEGFEINSPDGYNYRAIRR